MSDSPKQVAFYAAVVSAWVETKMERDKTIVTLSAGAIGLLVTLLTTMGVTSTAVFWLYVVAFVGFSVATVCSIVIFDRNSVLLEKVVKETTSDSKTLRRLDWITLTFFTLGVIFTIGIGAAAALTSLHHGGSMKDQAPKSQPSKDTVTKSLNGIQNLKPTTPTTPTGTAPMSLDGIQDMKPKAPAKPAPPKPLPDSGQKSSAAKAPTKKP